MGLTVNCCLYALRLIHLCNGFKELAYEWRGVYPRGLISGIDKVLQKKLC